MLEFILFFVLFLFIFGGTFALLDWLYGRTM
jgi:hypothetical protein